MYVGIHLRLWKSPLRAQVAANVSFCQNEELRDNYANQVIPQIYDEVE